MDRILDLSSLDFEGTTLRPDRHNNNAEVNSNTIPLATENVNEENAALQPDRFADNDEVNSSTIPLAAEDVNEENAALQPDRLADNDEVNSSTIPLATDDVNNDVPKHVGPNLVYADDDQHRSRPGRLAKHPAFGLLLSPAGYLTPPVDFVTDGQTDRRIKGVMGLL